MVREESSGIQWNLNAFHPYRVFLVETIAVLTTFSTRVM